jgi:uncharacterized protein (TIGR02266 family)
MSDRAMSSRRYPAKQDLLVQCDTWSDFAQLYASDVSQGGMFIVTVDPPPIFSEIQIVMHLPEGHEITLRGRIVHVIDSEQAARDGRSAGVGVQFIDLDPLRKHQIQQLVEFSRWEGAANNPSASYASHLFEVSASLPPSKVLEALPPAGDKPATPDARTPLSSARPGTRASHHARANEAQAVRNSRRPGGEDTGGNEASRRTGEREIAVPAQSVPAQPESAQISAAPPKPTDPVQLKLGMTHLAHKRFEEAVKTFEAMLKDNAGDRQARQWLHIAHARLRLKSNDDQGAAEHYQKALEAVEDNHEARKFVRDHHVKKRLTALPFGRYFVKKP